MTTATLRKRIHQHVDQVDDQILQLIDAMLERALESKKTAMNGAQLAELKRRVERRKQGNSKTLTPAEVRENARKVFKAGKK